MTHRWSGDGADMQLAAAIVAAIASALAYGAATAGQHSAVEGTRAGVAGLVGLLRDPRWLLASLGDVVGIGLQVLALGLGPVTVVQPFLVLSLPVAILFRPLFGSGSVHRAELVRCAVLVLALALFFVLLGNPGRGTTLGFTAAVVTSAVALVSGALAVLAVARVRPVVRAVVFGAVAGCWFGVVGVLLEAVGTAVSDHGWSALGRASCVAAVVGLLVLAAAAYLLVQFGFQLGPISASFPANLVLDPLIAVVLGAALLSEHVPTDPGRLVADVAVLAVVCWCTVELARERVAPPA